MSLIPLFGVSVEIPEDPNIGVWMYSRTAPVYYYGLDYWEPGNVWVPRYLWEYANLGALLSSGADAYGRDYRIYADGYRYTVGATVMEILYDYEYRKICKTLAGVVPSTTGD